MKIVFSFFLFLVSLHATLSSVDMIPTSKSRVFMGIKILDQKELHFSYLNNIKFSEISDLTYDKKDNSLYMLSDEGKLFTFHVVLNKHIESLKLLRAVSLRKKGGSAFKPWRCDSEGMTLDGRGRLLISFEERAKIAWFHKNSKKYGQMIKKFTLPKKLRAIKNYRSKNKSLESLAWHPKYGILTASEWALKKDHKKWQTIYALSGKEWHFNAEPEQKSAVTAIEVMDDGNLLVLERSYTGLMNPFVITLKKVYLGKKKMCKTKVLAKMNSHKGWSIDNFEGLARVGKRRYLMVSDNNDNFFQKTLLIYFEVL